MKVAPNHNCPPAVDVTKRRGEDSDSTQSLWLEFEQTLEVIDRQIGELQFLTRETGANYAHLIAKLCAAMREHTAELYGQLSGWQTVCVARHPRRPKLHDYITLMVQDFRELHGDKYYGDDRAIITGFGRVGRQKMLIVGHNKGRDLQERIGSNFGCPHPEGYRKALEKMRMAAKFGLPILCLLDTPGAYPGADAEARGQARAIARSLQEMFRLRTPIICIVTGEGCSGGALGIGVGDRVAMMQFAYYSVISPEACASILWRDTAKVREAAEALKLTSTDAQRFGLLDAIIPEPIGGAHRNPHEAIQNVQSYILGALLELRACKLDTIIEKRWERFRKLGVLEPGTD